MIFAENEMRAERSLVEKVLQGMTRRSRGIVFAVLGALALTYGSFEGKISCTQHPQTKRTCAYWRVTTFNYLIPDDFYETIGMLSVFVLALASLHMKNILL